MNILIVANHYVVCSARYAADAFTRLGHTVRHVGPAMGRNIWGLTLPEHYVWEPGNPLEVAVRLNENEIDLAIVMDSDSAILDWLTDFAPVPYIVWGVDNHVRDYRRPYFDHYFLAHRLCSQMDWGEYKDWAAAVENTLSFVRRMTHLPCCYDPTLHTPSPIPYTERAYDVACLGVMYPQRMAAVKALKEAGYKVIWGSGLVYESYRDAYHNARISLCLSACGDVAQRVFETAAMGNVVMTDNCPDFQKLKPNGFWLLDDTQPETIVSAVRDVLSNPDAAQEQIKASMGWVSGETWDARAQKIGEWYEQ